MKKIVLGLAALAAALPMAASAALYRCGTAYQDRPCEGGVPQETLRPSGARTPPGLTTRTAAEDAALPKPAPAMPGERTVEARRHCAAQGEQAERMAWKRQGGASRDQQIAEIGNERGTIHGRERERLVMTVYGTSGSAHEIRTRVEAECLQRAPLARQERQDARGCQMLRDMRKSAEIRSRQASTLREVELHKQNLKQLDDRLVNEGCA
jgi:hypothetical protein